MFSDDGWPTKPKCLPTRFGGPSGKSNETVMLNKHDESTISTSYRHGVRLKTRGGMPQFVRDAKEVDPTLDTLRGFTYFEGAGFSKVFDSYDASSKGTSTITQQGYWVAPFSSGEKTVPPAWAPVRDVWCLFGNSFRINAQARSAIPFTANITEKKVIAYALTNVAHPWYDGAALFAVGRVTVWDADNASVQLTPALPRTENRAMVYGQKIEVDKVWLQQLYFTGYVWNAFTGGWSASQVHVSMAKNSPKLTAVASSYSPTVGSVALSSPVSTFSTPSHYEARGSVGTWCGIQGYYESFAFIEYYYEYSVRAWPTTPWTNNMPWGVNTSSYGGLYEDDATWTGSFLGHEVAFSEYVMHQYASTGEQGSCPGAEFDVPRAWECDGLNRDSPFAPVVWASSFAPETYKHGGVNTSSYADGYKRGVVGYNAGWGVAYDDQLYKGNFSVTFKGYPLVSGNFERYHTTSRARVVGVESAVAKLQYESIMNNAYAYSPEWKRSGLTTYVPAVDFHEQVPAEVQSWLGKSHIFDHLWGVCPITFASQDLPNSTQSELSWVTTDFLLWDEDAGVRIYLRGSCTAVEGDLTGVSGSVTVTLKIESPTGTSEILLVSFDASGLGNLLPLTDTSPYHVPGPRLSGFPGALHYHQGSFCGAAYTEGAEGVPETTMLKFTLVPRDLSAVGEGWELRHNATTEFIPANLCEMLYAYVFSNKFGLDETDRYPVTRTAAYNWWMANFFGKSFPIEWRDGVVGTWSAGLQSTGSGHLDLGRI